MSSVTALADVLASKSSALADVLASKASAPTAGWQHESSTALIDALPAAIYTTDASGRITYYNQAAAELWGRRPELGTAEWCGSWKLYRPDGTPLPHDQCPMALALKQRRPIRGVEAIAERPDGTRVPFIPYPTPLFDSSGALTGAVNMLVDISARKQSEAALDREMQRRRQGDQARQHLAAIIESSDDAIVSKDLDGVIVSWNPGAERLFGYSADEIIGKSITVLIPPDHLDEEPEILRRIRRGERIEHYETVRRRKNGRLIDISLTVSPVRDDEGRIVGASKIARDITERKLAESRRDLLVAELSHRVKNTLATVISISHQSFARAPSLEDARRSFEGRIRALAQTHSRLAEAKWSGVDLESMLRDEFAPYAGDDSSNVQLSGPAVTLNPRSAVVLGMAVHELATNAAKYGALSVRSGRVGVDWDVNASEEDRTLTMRWTESGGPPVTPPVRSGFGRLLLERALAADLDGKVQMVFAESGLRCTISFPLHDDGATVRAAELTG